MKSALQWIKKKIYWFIFGSVALAAPLAISPIISPDTPMPREIIEQRTHNVKVYDMGDGTYKMQVNAGLLHYFDGESYKEIPPNPFPEGKSINSETDLDMVTIPAWGRAEVEDGGKTVRIYDKASTSIYRYTKPLIAPQGTKVFTVVDGETGEKKGDPLTVGELPDVKQTIDYDKESLIRDDSLGTEVSFEITGNHIRFKLPDGVKPENLQAYDDTDTGSTNNKDSYVRQHVPTTNFGSSNPLLLGSNSTEGSKALIQFTLPSDPGGTITDIDFVVTKQNYTNQSNDPGNAEIHEGTRSNWVESEVTWNVYSTGNNWTTAGGDYSATIIDAIANGTIQGISNDNPVAFTIQGSGATNPLSLNWTDTVDLFMVWQNYNGVTNADNFFFYSKEETTSSFRPYLEITYTASVSRRIIKTNIMQ